MHKLSQHQTKKYVFVRPVWSSGRDMKVYLHTRYTLYFLCPHACWTSVRRISLFQILSPMRCFFLDTWEEDCSQDSANTAGVHLIKADVLSSCSEWEDSKCRYRAASISKTVSLATLKCRLPTAIGFLQEWQGLKFCDWGMPWPQYHNPTKGTRVYNTTLERNNIKNCLTLKLWLNDYQLCTK